MTVPDYYCDHIWVRDDAHTKQCVKCKTYSHIAPEGQL